MTSIRQHGHWKKWLKISGAPKGENIAVILHIGMEKTGSKAIQTWLAEHREQLAKEGWYIPTTLGAINHRQVSFLGYDAGRRDDGTKRRGIMTNKDLAKYKVEVLKRLKNEIKTAVNAKQNALIISTELASSRLIRKREIKRLILTMQEAGCSPMLVTLFRRDPVKLLESRYSTAVLHEGWDKMNPAKPGSKEANLFGNQIKLQKKWCSVINQIKDISFDVYAYATDTLKQGSSAATIANFLGCDLDMIKSAAGIKKNQPLPLLNIRLVAVVNRLGRSKLPWVNELAKGLKALILKTRLGSWKYRLPKRLKKKYRRKYKTSVLPEKTEWLLWSSWVDEYNKSTRR